VVLKIKVSIIGSMCSRLLSTSASG